MQSINLTDLFTKGRSGDPRLGEEVKTLHSTAVLKGIKNPIVLYGCPDDTGVRRNRGREGAKNGPESIRRHLYKMTPPMHMDWKDKVTLIDGGNIRVEKSITETHKNAFNAAKEFSESKATLIALGGGHDFAAPNFLGFLEGCKIKKPVGLINIDPHLDVRELEENLPHSGTPFRQIIESGKISPKNFIQFGIKSNRNSQKHFLWCKKQKIQIKTWEEIRSHSSSVASQFLRQLTSLSKNTGAVGITIDIDSCESAEGSSAAPVLGFTATELYWIAKAAGSRKNVLYFEICEVAPDLDPTARSSRIAAELIFAFLEARALVN